MGLGKTIQCIAHIAMMIERKVMGPFLVVAPLSTLPNWISEFKRFTPEVSARVSEPLCTSAWHHWEARPKLDCLLCLSQVSVLLYHGSQPERAKLLKQIRRPQGPLSICPVVVTSFEISMIDRKFLQVRFQLSQWDEHTNIYGGNDGFFLSCCKSLFFSA